MPRLWRVCAGILLFGCADALLPASFDCGKPSDAQEKTICANTALSKLDEETETAYEFLRSNLSEKSAREVQQDQREWTLWLRQACPPLNDPVHQIEECLTRAYSERLQKLKEGLQHVTGMTFFPRIKVFTAPDAHRDGSWQYDPGFGIGRFNWPEIDRPTPSQSVWNAAVHAQVVRLSLTGRASASATDFVPASVADSDTWIDYKIKGANERFISVELEVLCYDYGAAHPWWTKTSFEWWLQLERALKADDVFRPQSGWEAFLGQRSYEELISGEHANRLFDPKTMRTAALDCVKQIQFWTIDARGLTVAFPDYSVGPHSAGKVSVELGWEELRPYLARGFDPAGLPMPI
jgi:uncharacterized protein